MEIQSHTGLRGIAALVVFVVHLFIAEISKTHWFLSFYAVDLFFILSGFILYWVYVKNKNKIVWYEFGISRIARILPLYYLTTFLCIPIVWNQLPLDNTQKLFEDVFANLLLLSAITKKFTFNGPAWSISVEWFCYFILFPTLVLCKKWILRGKIGLILAIFGTLILSRLFVISYRGGFLESIGILIKNMPLERGVIGFSMGFLLCFIFCNTKTNAVPNWVFDFLLAGIFSLILLSAIRIIPPHFILYSLSGLVFVTACEKGVLVKWLKNHFVQWLGTRSYSIYLWHWLVIEYSKALRPIIGVWIYSIFIFTFVGILSEISYRLFEMPVRRKIRDYKFGLHAA